MRPWRMRTDLGADGRPAIKHSDIPDHGVDGRRMRQQGGGQQAREQDAKRERRVMVCQAEVVQAFILAFVPGPVQ